MNTLKLSRGRKNSSNNYSESTIVVAAYVPSSGLRVVLRALVVVVVLLDRSVAPEVHSSDDHDRSPSRARGWWWCKCMHCAAAGFLAFDLSNQVVYTPSFWLPSKTVYYIISYPCWKSKAGPALTFWWAANQRSVDSGSVLRGCQGGTEACSWADVGEVVD